jgi:hypothetical protein
MKSYKLAILSASVGLLWGMNASAQTFNYNNEDLLLGFNSPGIATNDLVVDIGPASNYTGATGPITISGNFFTSQQLTDAGLSLNNLYFSVFGDISPGHPGTANTLWVTRPRASFGTQTSPWSAQSSTQLATSRSQIESIASGAQFISFNNALPAQDNTATAVIVYSAYNQSSESSISYSVGIGAGGNFAGNFGSNNNIEQNTPGSFTSPVQSDLYEMDPGSAGSYLGYFQLDPDGTLTFNPTAVPEPTTLSMAGIGIMALVAARRMRNKKIIL